MVENPANALPVSRVHCVHLVYSYLPLRVNTLHISVFFFLGVLFLGPCAKPCGQQSYYTHVYSSCGPYGGRIPLLVLSTYSYYVYAHACWRFYYYRHPLSTSPDRLGPPVVGQRPHYSVLGSLGVGREGCVRRAFPDTTPP